MAQPARARKLGDLVKALGRAGRHRPLVRDAVAIAGLALLAFGLVQWFDISGFLARAQAAHGDWALGRVPTVCVILVFALTAYGYRRGRDLGRATKARREAEAELADKINALTRAEKLLHTIIDNVPATILVRELPERRYVLVNRQAEKLIGIAREEMLGKTAADIFPAEIARLVDEHDELLMRSEQAIAFDEVPLTSPSGGTRIARARGIAIAGEGARPKYLLNVVQDVTARKHAEARIEHLAHFDSLTDLPNRAAFNEHIAATIERAAASGQSLAVICADLDRLKEINDVFGHAVGDALLCEVANRLQAASAGAFVARLGGDEFVVISAEDPQPAASEALAERILRAMDGEIDVAGRTLRTGMSIGVAIYPADGTDASVLLANADAALYRAKAEARGSIRFFEPDMDRRLRERRALQHELQDAAARGELTLFYQPQASIDGRITGFEALVRWHHPTRGLIAPSEFIPLAEESGLIVTLGEWIMREACREAASWSTPLTIAINFSPIQFRHGDLPALIHTVLFETGLAASRLEIEITEGVLMDDFNRAVSVLRRLKALGVRIAMDDFGTGYSSLSYLQAFPFDKIKIDRAFIANLDRNPQSATIIRAVIGLGRGLNLPVIAEGVETSEQLAFLKREACNEVQGYLVGRPAPIAQYTQLTGRAEARDVRARAG